MDNKSKRSYLKQICCSAGNRPFMFTHLLLPAKSFIPVCEHTSLWLGFVAFTLRYFVLGSLQQMDVWFDTGCMYPGFRPVLEVH